MLQVVRPTVLYSLEACPLTEKILHRLYVVQRKMLRRIIGWVHSGDDATWEGHGHRMKLRFQNCMEIYPVSEWSEAIHIRKSILANQIDVLPLLTFSALKWDPIACSTANFCCAYRSRGHPLTRW